MLSHPGLHEDPKEQVLSGRCHGTNNALALCPCRFQALSCHISEALAVFLCRMPQYLRNALTFECRLLTVRAPIPALGQRLLKRHHVLGIDSSTYSGLSLPKFFAGQLVDLSSLKRSSRLSVGEKLLNSVRRGVSAEDLWLDLEFSLYSRHGHRQLRFLPFAPRLRFSRTDTLQRLKDGFRPLAVPQRVVPYWVLYFLSSNDCGSRLDPSIA